MSQSKGHTERLKKHCEECGKAFLVYRPQQRFCCGRCRLRAFTKKREAELAALRKTVEELGL